MSRCVNINVKEYSILNNNALGPSIAILLTCGKYLHDCIISLRVDLTNNTSLMPSRFIEVSMPKPVE